MQAPADDKRIEALEKQIDSGFAEMRAEFKAVRSEIKGAERELRGEIVAARGDARSDFRTLLAVSFAMWVATILSFVGVLVQQGL